MKKILSTFLQLLLFLFTFAVGSFTSPFKIQSNLDHSNHLAITHYFIWDGLLLMLALFALFLIVEALMKKLRAAAPWTTLAVTLATMLGLALKLGFLTREF